MYVGRPIAKLYARRKKKYAENINWIPVAGWLAAREKKKDFLIEWPSSVHA